MSISVDPPERSRELARELGLQFPLLGDPDRGVIRAFGVEDAENAIAWPSIFVVDADRRVRWRSLAQTFTARPAPAVILGAIDALGR